MSLKILLVRAKPDFMDMILGIPIGLSMIGAMAEQAGHQVDILDLALERSQDEAAHRLQQRLAEQRYAVAGLTCMTVEYQAAGKAAQIIRNAQPDCRIVFGGQHPTIQPLQVVSQDYCDLVVTGEGEQTFKELLDALEKKRDLGTVAGLVFRENGETISTRPRTAVENLDELPWPAYHLLEIERYFKLESARYTPKHPRAMQIFTSRGCPWRCTYCHDLFGKTFRGRSAENVFGEIKLLHDRYGIREYMIEDDIFNLDIERAKKICDLIIESRVRIHMQFGNGLRAERFDEELVQKLAQAGTHHIAIAIESASPRIQKLIKKNLKLDRTQQAIRWMRKHKINSLGFFMIGFPFETVQEIEQTIRFASETDLDEALFSIVIPYSGTELNRQVYEMGLFDPDAASSGGKGITLIRSQEWDFRKLKQLQRKAYLTFFTSRYRFIRMMPRLFNPSSTKKYLKAIERNFLSYGGGSTSRIN
jgi:anaerobic magnesium-protoporphyrin IX monomethyl ester cyclase